MAKATIPSFITEELQKDEPVIWLGQPDKRLAMLGGLPMAAFALFMLCTLLPKIQMALSLNGWMSLLFNGFNLLLFIPICGCLYTPFAIIQRAQKVFYVVTDRHIFTFSRSGQRTMERFDRDQATPLYQFNVLGRLSLIWSVPGTFKGSDGLIKPNTVSFFGIEPQALQIIGGDFPTFKQAGKLIR